MKKTITLALLLCITLFSNAQTIAGFENISLSTQTYRDGKDSADKSGFFSGKAFFPNYYDTSFGGFWANGFAISNLTNVSTDSTTLNFTKEFNAIVSNGADSTANYAIVQNDAMGTKNAVIHLLDTNESMVAGCYITNSNYTYLSMKWGDMIGKKFGDSDFFRIKIIGFLAGHASDTISFSLAEGKNIVTTWTWLDLSSLGYVDSVMFVLKSSDMGQWGMNTPAFFCMDQFKTIAGLNGLNQIKNKITVQVFPNPATESIAVTAGKSKVNGLSIADPTGKIILNGQTNKLNIESLAPGIYFVYVFTEDGLVTKRLIKE